MTGVRRAALTVAVACLAAAWLAVVAPAYAQEPLEPRRLAEVDFAAGIAVHPDGRIFVTERAGRIRVIARDGLRPEPVAEIPTTTTGETGLLGLAVAPDGRSLYAFATSPEGDANRIWRVPLGGGSPGIVIDGLPAAVYHNGGGVAFDRTGMLLVSNGEQHSDARAQDPDVLGGKIYRFTPSGEVPGDNPFGASPSYAIGLRNPYGLTVDAATGDVYATENGPSSFDEVNRIEAGANYGWPDVLGPADGARPSGPGRYRDPLVAYREIVVPTGVAVADPRTALAPYRGDVFVGTYGEGAVHRLRLDDSGNVVADEIAIDAGAPVVALAWGPRGLYYSTTEAVFLVPIGAGERSRPTPDETPLRTPAGTPTTFVAPDPPNDGFPVAVVVGLAAAAVVAAIVAFVATRRRR